MNRRRFLSIAALGAAATATAGFSFWRQEASHNPDTMRGRLLQELQNLESPCLSDAGQLGRVYLQNNLDERDGDVLSQAIADACCSDSERNNKLRTAHLREQIRADFTSGQVERVNGWILSRTEARLYALSFLSDDSAIN